MRPRGSSIRPIGRRESDSSPVSSKLSPSCPARMPAMSRTSVPAFAQSIGRPGARSPRRPFPNTRSVSEPCSYTSTPSARTAAIVASVSAERPKPVTCVSPSQIAPISTERCEIDLSPGTATWPTSRGTGSTRSDPRAAVIRRSPAPPRRRSPAPRAAQWRARPRPPPRRAWSASRHARSRRDRARSPRR